MIKAPTAIKSDCVEGKIGKAEENMKSLGKSNHKRRQNEFTLSRELLSSAILVIRAAFFLLTYKYPRWLPSRGEKQSAASELATDLRSVRSL